MVKGLSRKGSGFLPVPNIQPAPQAPHRLGQDKISSSFLFRPCDRLLPPRHSFSPQTPFSPAPLIKVFTLHIWGDNTVLMGVSEECNLPLISDFQIARNLSQIFF